MIKRVIERVTTLFKRRPPRPREPKRIGAADHGINQELVARSALRVCETLQKAGHRAYLVGGAVRDLLLGIAPKDFDVATDATPEQVKSHFRRAIIIGRRFRLVHVMFGQETIEVSTFRALDNPDRKTDEHGRVLADNLFGEQIEDAARRDFSVNALYYDPSTREVIDYHDGVKDLRRKRLRMIGDPETRYREDPVRMLRAVRFAAKLGFEIDEATREPIPRLAVLIENVPAARLFDEMLKLLSSGHSVACITRLRMEGLHHGLLPLLDVILEQPAGERFVLQALARTDERVRAGKSISPGFLFATLLWHDVLVKWNARTARGEHRIPALNNAIDDALDAQTEKLAIQRRFVSDMREIWGLQPRFERRSGRSPFRLLEHLRFRAGYDFLLLRAAADEVPAELADWWTRFAHAGVEEREALRAGGARAESPEGAGEKRRRRSRGRGANASRSASTAAAARLTELVKRIAYIGLGSNQGEIVEALNSAIELAAFDRADRAWWRSRRSTDRRRSMHRARTFSMQSPRLETALEPYALLLHLLDIELMLGRKRRGLKKNAPRNVDLDLLLLGDMIIQSTPLTLPHPRLHLRAFVLRPLLDLAPEIRIPGQGPAAAFLDAVDDQKVEPLEAPAAP